MKSPVCAIDIGNTTTSIGLVDCSNLSCIDTFTFSSEKYVQKIPETVKKLASNHNAAHNLPVNICTVIRSLQDEIISSVSSLSFTGLVHLVSFNSNLPLTIAYDNPEILGTDRIANCLYCLNRFPDTNCIIIDAGTTVTVDLFSSRGVFEGGYIFPGFELQLHSLSENTAELPHVTDTTGKNQIPPQSTLTAIASGTHHCVVGGLTHLIKCVREKYPSYQKILTCGGAWKGIMDDVEFEHEYIPDITLIGIALYKE